MMLCFDKLSMLGSEFDIAIAEMLGGFVKQIESLH